MDPPHLAPLSPLGRVQHSPVVAAVAAAAGPTEGKSNIRERFIKKNIAKAEQTWNRFWGFWGAAT